LTLKSATYSASVVKSNFGNIDL